MSDWERIKEETLQKIKPTKSEEVTLLSVADEVIERLDDVLRISGINGKAELHGSVPHGTWVRGQMDIDVFVVLDEFKERGQLGEVLDKVREHTDWGFTIAFAEHPYLQTEIEGYKIDIVPCFRRKQGERIRSATDRTPMHTEWLKTRLGDLGDEVRILKQFLKVGEMYGAEIKVGGFSGYLCELLVVKYGSFMDLMETAASWGEQEVIGFNGETRVFDAPLVVYDPVDKNRNVASALRQDVYSRFVEAAKAFVDNPREVFFVLDTNPIEKETILDLIESRILAFIVIEESRAEVPDVLWGMIWKSSSAIERQLTQKGFKVLGSTAWSNDLNRHVLVYEVEEENLPEVYKHYGPQNYLTLNVEQFKAAYKERDNLVAGPELDGDTWYVMLRRRLVGLKENISKLLEDGGRSIGVSQRLSVRILQHHRVLVGSEVEPYLDEDFSRCLFRFLRGRPYWDE